QAGQQEGVGAPLRAGAAAPALQLGLDCLPGGAVHQGRVNVREHHPVLDGVDLAAALAAGLDLPALDPVIAAVVLAVPNQVPAVDRVLENLVDGAAGPLAPLRLVGVRPGRRDAAVVQ